jgi:hypothetical protein
MDQFKGRIAQMIARGFKPVAWVAAIGTAALGCYMLSLQVAAERSELAGIERRIVSTRQQIRALQTELGTRGRLQQLEQWNAEVLALSAPVSGQFLESNVSLARFDVQPQQTPVDREVRMASAETPPAAAPAQPALRLASAPVPARTEASAAPAAPTVPAIRRASLVTPTPTPATPAQRPAVRRAALDVAATPAAAPARPHTAEPRRSAGLLDDDTLLELRSAARSEQGGGTRN